MHADDIDENPKPAATAPTDRDIARADPAPAVDDLQAELDAADAADAPEIAEALASRLARALDDEADS